MTSKDLNNPECSIKVHKMKISANEVSALTVNSTYITCRLATLYGVHTLYFAFTATLQQWLKSRILSRIGYGTESTDVFTANLI
jgi:hypothetical protein